MLADYRRGDEWLDARVAELRKTWGGTAVLDPAARGLVSDAEEISGPKQAEAHNALAALVDRRPATRQRAGPQRVGQGRPVEATGRLPRPRPKGSTDITPLAAAALAVHSVRTRPSVELWGFYG